MREYRIEIKILQHHNIPSYLKNDTFYVEADKLGTLLGLKNIKTSMKDFLSEEWTYLPINTKGGSQQKKCLSEKGIKRLLCSSRKPKAVLLSKELGIKNNNKHIPLETSFIINIRKAFQGENIMFQYFVDKYYLDVYFPDYNLAVEFDEDRHRFSKEADGTREHYIREKIGCSFLIISQSEDIFESINKIFKKIQISYTLRK